MERSESVCSALEAITQANYRLRRRMCWVGEVTDFAERSGVIQQLCRERSHRLRQKRWYARGRDTMAWAKSQSSPKEEEANRYAVRWKVMMLANYRLRRRTCWMSNVTDFAKGGGMPEAETTMAWAKSQTSPKA